MKKKVAICLIILSAVLGVTAVFYFSGYRKKKLNEVNTSYAEYSAVLETSISNTEEVNSVVETIEESSEVKIETDISVEPDEPLYYSSQDMKYVDKNPKLQAILNAVLEDYDAELTDLYIEVYEGNEEQYEGSFTFGDLGYMDFKCFDIVFGVLYLNDGTSICYTADETESGINVIREQL